MGGGVGFARNRVDAFSIKQDGSAIGRVNGDTKYSLAWQLSLGTGIELTQNLALDLGYRYMDLGKIQTGDRLRTAVGTFDDVRVKGDLRAHELQAKVRYTF